MIIITNKFKTTYRKLTYYFSKGYSYRRKVNKIEKSCYKNRTAQNLDKLSEKLEELDFYYNIERRSFYQFKIWSNLRENIEFAIKQKRDAKLIYAVRNNNLEKSKSIS